MSGLFGIFGNDNDDEKEAKNAESLRLHKEELDINKKRVQAGEVELSKEIIEEHKVVDVPVTHEEVVIERRSLNNEASDSPISAEDTIKIPVSEEQVEVDKHTVLTEEIVARKRDVEDTIHVDETLKREKARVHTNGSVDVINEADDNLS
jgi:uncharacterized protein (TIGR02271 family)